MADFIMGSWSSGLRELGSRSKFRLALGELFFKKLARLSAVFGPRLRIGESEQRCRLSGRFSGFQDYHRASKRL